MTPEDELRDLISDWRRHVDSLPIWSAGEERLHALMSTAVGARVATARYGAEFPGFGWESFLDFVLSWHFKYPIGNEICREEDALQAVRAAMAAMRFEPLAAAIRAGGYRVRKTGSNFRVSFRWGMGLEVADMYLERQAAPKGLEGPTPEELEWASGQSRRRFNLLLPPEDIIRTTMRRTRRAIQSWTNAYQNPPLSDDFGLGDGLTVGVMTEVIAALMATAELGEMAHSAERARGTTLLHASEEGLIESLGRLCDDLSTEIISRAVQRLMAGPGKSVRTSLLIPNTGIITVLPIAMFPRTVEAIVLRTAASDPSRYGPVGKQQGQRARVWSQWLSKIPGVRVTESTKVRGLRGRVEGDLDVVAIDPVLRKGLILELKWPIDAVTLSEASKTDEAIMVASAQLGRVRSALRSGAVQEKFPEGWPHFSEIDWSWGIGMPQQLTCRPLPEGNMFATSFRYVSQLDSINSLSELVGILEKPIVPELGKDYRIGNITMPLRGRQVRLEVLECKEVEWRPSIRR